MIIDLGNDERPTVFPYGREPQETPGFDDVSKSWIMVP